MRIRALECATFEGPMQAKFDTIDRQSLQWRCSRPSVSVNHVIPAFVDGDHSSVVSPRRVELPWIHTLADSSADLGDDYIDFAIRCEETCDGNDLLIGYIGNQMDAIPCEV